MQLPSLLHKDLKKELPFVHKSRLKNLCEACEVATKSNKLTLTGLGRGLKNKNQTGSNIQKIDRLLSNVRLQKERVTFYTYLASKLIKECTRVWIHIDWSCINAATNLYILRASISMKGRSIVIYEESYFKKNENNHATHVQFLEQLKKILPLSVKPVIVTDAGFRAPWFAAIYKLGWDFVGRLRNKNLVLLDNAPDWCLSSIFFEKAKKIPTYLGHGVLTKDRKLPANFILYKGASKNRHKVNYNKKNSRSGKSKRCSKSSKEPWVLVTSLNLSAQTAKEAVMIYKQRMRIEENIRDTKCPNYGLGLKMSLTKTPQRMNILLLIAALSTFLAWLAGVFTTLKGKAANFQAHSAKFISVLSKVYLGREALKKGVNLTKMEFHLLFNMLYELSLESQQETLS